MLKALLVNTNLMRPPVAPLGLDYIGAALRGRGHEVDLLDLAFAGDPGKALEQVLEGSSAEHGYRLVGLSVRNTDDCYMGSQAFFLEPVREMVSVIRSRTRIPVVLGGVGFSVMPEAILDYTGADLGVAGSGERALAALLERSGRPEDVPGLVWKGKGGEWRKNPPDLEPLDGLSLSRRALADNRRYFAEGGQIGVETKRGCGERCLYCADPVSKGRKIRVRDPRSVVREIQGLLEKGIDHFHWCDSEFNLPEAHARAVCEALMASGLGRRIRWYAYLAPAPFPPDLATLMRDAGCAGIDFGADSGSRAMLAALGRSFGPEDLVAAARTSRASGIPCMFDLLIGGPGETRESLRETVDLVRRADPDRVGLSVGVRIYPGTGLASLVRREGFHPGNPNLVGLVEGNESLLRPVFYLSAGLGPDPHRVSAFVKELVGDDPRFFGVGDVPEGQDYNYNENTVLIEAIRRGYRGAYWDILRRLAEGLS